MQAIPCGCLNVTREAHRRDRDNGRTAVGVATVPTVEVDAWMKASGVVPLEELEPAHKRIAVSRVFLREHRALLSRP
jgi:hypothetical protein